MEFPVDVALARAVPTLPTGPGWWFEPKFDGHRMILVRTSETVLLYARSGRLVTPWWADLARAGQQLLPGTVLDGEAVVWSADRVDFSAAQSRAASSPARACLLAELRPASLPVWDLLSHPELGDVRGRPYVERRGLRQPAHCATRKLPAAQIRRLGCRGQHGPAARCPTAPPARAGSGRSVRPTTPSAPAGSPGNGVRPTAGGGGAPPPRGGPPAPPPGPPPHRAGRPRGAAP
ncbi:hypothetical protein ACFXPE_03330, partial [Streptomyces scopuliridis]|uniref:ATP-dependent DNA ligase n=1 Tax=Streptomyces scopuliridis TaxID=452529 RepID=UPI00368E0ADF